MKDPVLITGVRGFVGRVLAGRLREIGMEVHGTTRRADLKELPGGTALHTVVESAPAVWSKLLEALCPRTVFHLASGAERHASPAASAAYVSATLSAAADLLESFSTRLPSSIVLLGSGEEYGAAPVPYREDSPERPLTSYGLAKLAVTALGRQTRAGLGWPIVTVRPSVVYGPGQKESSFVSRLLSAASGGQSVPMTPGDQTRDFVHVNDLVEALILVAGAPDLADVVNVGFGREISLRAAEELLRRVVGRPIPVEFGALPYREGEPMRYAMDSSRMRSLYEWSPAISLEDGLRELMRDAPR